MPASIWSSQCFSFQTNQSKRNLWGWSNWKRGLLQVKTHLSIQFLLKTHNNYPIFIVIIIMFSSSGLLVAASQVFCSQVRARTSGMVRSECAVPNRKKRRKKGMITCLGQKCEVANIIFFHQIQPYRCLLQR